MPLFSTQLRSFWEIEKSYRWRWKLQPYDWEKHLGYLALALVQGELLTFYPIDRFVLMVVHTGHVQASEMGSPTNKLVWKSSEKHDLAGSRFWVELWKQLNYTCPVGFLKVTNQLNQCSSSGEEQGRHGCVRNVSPWQVPLHEKLKEQEMNFLLHLMMVLFKVLM